MRSIMRDNSTMLKNSVVSISGVIQRLKKLQDGSLKLSVFVDKPMSPLGCPHCGKEISEKLISKHFASKGGKMSKRVLTPEQARNMVKTREDKKKIILNLGNKKEKRS